MIIPARKGFNHLHRKNLLTYCMFYHAAVPQKSGQLFFAARSVISGYAVDCELVPAVTVFDLKTVG